MRDTCEWEKVVDRDSRSLLIERPEPTEKSWRDLARGNWPGTEGGAGKEPGVLGAGSQSARSPTEWATGAWMSGMSGIGARVSCLNASRNGQVEQEPPVGDVVLGWQCGLGWYCVTWPGHGCYCPAEDCKGPSIYYGEVRQGQVAYREPKRPRPFRVRATYGFLRAIARDGGHVEFSQAGSSGILQRQRAVRMVE